MELTWPKWQIRLDHNTRSYAPPVSAETGEWIWIFRSPPLEKQP